MRRASLHPAPAPRAPLPFTLPSRKREGGVSSTADGHIASAGAKWASPYAGSGGESPAVSGSTVDTVVPSVYEQPNYPSATTQHGHAHRTGAQPPRMAAIGASGDWREQSGRGDSVFSQADSVSHHESSYIGGLEMGAGQQAPSPRPTPTPGPQWPNPWQKTNSSPQPVDMAQSTVHAHPEKISSVHESDDVDWADDMDASGPIPLADAAALPDVVLPTPPLPSQGNAKMEGQQSQIENAWGVPKNPENGSSYGALLGSAPARTPARPSQDLRQQLSRQPGALGGFVGSGSSHSQRNQMSVQSSGSVPSEALEIGASEPAVAAVDLETVQKQQDVMKKKAEDAAERQRLYEKEEAEQRARAEQKLRELEARLRARSEENSKAASAVSPTPVSPTGPKILLRRTRFGEATSPVRADVTQGPFPSSDGRDILRSSAIPGPGSASPDQRRLDRPNRRVVVDSGPTKAPGEMTYSPDDRGPRARRRRAEAHDTAHAIVRVCIRNSMKATDAGNSSPSVQSEALPVSETGKTAPQKVDQRDEDSPAPVGVNGVEVKVKKPRKRGGRAERLRRERRDAREAMASAALQSEATNVGIAVQKDSNLPPARSVQESRNEDKDIVPVANDKEHGGGETPSAAAWGKGSHRAAPASFEDISRAFSNHPSNIPLAGAPLLPIGATGSATLVKESAWSGSTPASSTGWPVEGKSQVVNTDEPPSAAASWATHTADVDPDALGLAPDCNSLGGISALESWPAPPVDNVAVGLDVAVPASGGDNDEADATSTHIAGDKRGRRRRSQQQARVQRQSRRSSGNKGTDRTAGDEFGRGGPAGPVAEQGITRSDGQQGKTNTQEGSSCSVEGRGGDGAAEPSHKSKGENRRHSRGKGGRGGGKGGHRSRNGAQGQAPGSGPGQVKA